jgi:small subunit ribosomal protein S16
MRLGKIREPYYRIVVADSRTKRDGRVIETIGKYHPKQDPSLIEVDSDRARYWLSVGAQPTEPVAAILKITGDWQAHKGLPAPEKGLLTAEPKPDRKAVFEAAAKQADEPAPKPAKKTAAKKAATAAAGESSAAEAAPSDEATREAAARDEPPADAAQSDETTGEAAAEAEPAPAPEGDAATEAEPAPAPEGDTAAEAE